jgi:hypothetical protein
MAERRFEHNAETLRPRQARDGAIARLGAAA